jgi:hypothetical protein
MMVEGAGDSLFVFMRTTRRRYLEEALQDWQNAKKVACGRTGKNRPAFFGFQTSHSLQVLPSPKRKAAP